MESHANIIVAGLTLLTIIICTTALVGLDKMSAELYMAVVIGPSVAGLIAYISHSKGVQQGSEATVSPPPSA